MRDVISRLHLDGLHAVTFVGFIRILADEGRLPFLFVVILQQFFRDMSDLRESEFILVALELLDFLEDLLLHDVSVT